MDRRDPALSPTPTTGPSPGNRPPPDRAEELMRTCPTCGKELAERKCKLFCPDPRCGFFLSCADFQ